MEFFFDEDKAKNCSLSFYRLYSIISTLRSPSGCPWDRVQTAESLHPHLVEEVYELLNAIHNKDSINIEEELGDIYLVNSLIAYIFEVEGLTSVDKVINQLCDKLIRRHPHVFSSNHAQTPEEGRKHWLHVKQLEKLQKGILNNKTTTFDSVGRGLPPLERAAKLQDKMVNVNLSWQNDDHIMHKLKEEVQELDSQLLLKDKDKQRLSEELGDILFTAVGFARHLGLNPSELIHYTNEKIIARLNFIENKLSENQLDFGSSPRDLLENLWNKSKKENKKL